MIGTTVENVQQVAAIELQKKTCFNKQGLNHVWLHSESTLFTELFKLDGRNTVDNFQQVAEITTFPQTRSKIMFDALWIQCFLQNCSNSMIRNTVDNFLQVSALKYRKKHFSINKV